MVHPSEVAKHNLAASFLRMLAELSVETRFVICTLAVWRLTHFIVSEEGPWDIVVRLRVLMGESMAGRAMDCFYCSSVWIAIPFTFLVGKDVLSWLIFWLAISGGASLLEQGTHKKLASGAVLPLYNKDKEE